MGLTPVVSQTGVRFLADTPARIGSFLAWLACATLLYSTVVSSLAAGVLLVALGALTACYPVGGVLVSAALVPIVGAAFAAFAGQGGEWAEAIVLATIAGFMLRRSAGLERWPSGACGSLGRGVCRRCARVGRRAARRHPGSALAAAVLDDTR